MSFLIYLHKENFQPENPQILDDHLKANTDFTFVDFIPSVIKKSCNSVVNRSNIEYHSFRMIIKTANDWLAENSDFEVINCETIKLFFKYNDNQNFYELRQNELSSYVYSTEKNFILKALRIWIKRIKTFKEKSLVNEENEKKIKDLCQLENLNLNNIPNLYKRRWTQPQNQLKKISNDPENLLKKNSQENLIHSAEQSPKKNALQQQQEFRLQQYSSQNLFFSKKLKRQLSCPPSNNLSSQYLANLNKKIPSLRKNSLLTKKTNQKVLNEVKEISNKSFLNYFDIIPNFKHDNEHNKFENLDQCIDKLNEAIRNNLIKGKIISIETGIGEATVDWKIETEKSFTNMASKNVFFLRCFYLENEIIDKNEEIKVIDFIPSHISGGGFFKKPKFENYSSLFLKLSDWLTKNSQFSYLNSQTLDIKLKNYVSQNLNDLIDTKSMSFSEHGDYIRIIRLVYKKKIKNDISLNTYSNDFEFKKCSKEYKYQIKNKSLEKLNFLSINDSEELSYCKDEKFYRNLIHQPIYLYSKLFLNNRKGQTIYSLREQIHNWFSEFLLRPEFQSNELPKPKILFCETMQIFCKQEINTNNDFLYLSKAAEETFMYNRFGSKNGYLINVFRIYLDVGWFSWQKLMYSKKIQPIKHDLNKIESDEIHFDKTLKRRESFDFYINYFKDKYCNKTDDKSVNYFSRRSSSVDISDQNSKTEYDDVCVERIKKNFNNFKISSDFSLSKCLKSLSKPVNENKKH